MVGRGAPALGSPRGSLRGRVTEARVRVLTRTGMLPLDFLTAVYRDELYDQYDVREVEGTVYYVPRRGASKIPVDLQTRVSAAISAAPYVHRKMPVGVDVQATATVSMTAERLRRLSTSELASLLALMDKLGVEMSLEKHPASATVDQQGRVIENGVC